MPTGLTQHIADGTETSLAQFAARCARHMGALIMLRDEPEDAPLPERLTPNTEYHDARLKTARTDIDGINAMTAEQLDGLAKLDFEERHESWVKNRDDGKAKYARYTALLNQLDNSEHGLPEGLVELMRAQLVESRKFDCWTDEDRAKFDPEPTPMTGEQWKAGKLYAAYKDIAYHTTKRQEEIDRTAERQAWLDKLHTALKGMTK